MKKRVLLIIPISLFLTAASAKSPEKAASRETLKEKMFVNFNASEGTATGEIKLEWKYRTPGIPVAVYRSTFPEGPCEEMGVTDTGIYSDRKAVPGIRYWYRLLPLVEGAPLELSSPVSGYAAGRPVKGVSLEKVLKRKNRVIKPSRNREKRKRDGKFTDFLRSFYTNNVKLSIIVAIGEKYIKRGDLILLRDFDGYRFDQPKRLSYFIKKGRYEVKYHSIRFSRLLRESKALDPKEDRLTKRILENMMVYCIPTGKKERMNEEGVTEIIHIFEAVGVSTEYYRDNRDWRFNTVMTASSNKKIRKMMRKARRRR